MIYIALFVACIIVELSPRIHTDSVIKKIGIGFIMVGSLVELSGKNSDFVEIGVFVYMASVIFNAYLNLHKRRGSDR